MEGARTAAHVRKNFFKTTGGNSSCPVALRSSTDRQSETFVSTSTGEK